VIDRWKPQLLVNLGTCGGFEGRINQGEIILVERTVIYDILEQMTDSRAAIQHYSTELELDWLGKLVPTPVRRGLLVSGDRDIVSGDIASLISKYGAVAADWESGAIAWVARRNATRLLILRGVSDLVSETGGEAYGDYELFVARTRQIMSRLLDVLPPWLDIADGASTA
jgi:adenosylhomocysteine nucleosidase